MIAQWPDAGHGNRNSRSGLTCELVRPELHASGRPARGTATSAQRPDALIWDAMGELREEYDAAVLSDLPYFIDDLNGPGGWKSCGTGWPCRLT